MSSFWHDHPWLGGLLGDGDVARHLGASKALAQMCVVEAAYARALGQTGQVPQDVAARASDAILTFNPDVDDLRSATARDGVVVPGLVRQLKAALPEDLHPALHTGLTSQDVIDTALMLCLQPVLDLFASRLEALDSAFEDLENRFGDLIVQGRTRMQAALKIKMSHRIAGWRRPLRDQRADLARVAADLRVIQFGGPVGDRASFGAHAETLAGHFASELELKDPGYAWHTDRRRIIAFGHWMSATTGALGKFGTDIALLSQQGIDDVVLSGGGSSSAMAHKTNPIAAEVLMSLARWNASLVACLHQSQPHEYERSGNAWTLEWRVVPQMIEATARSLSAAADLAAQVSCLGKDN